MDYISLEILKNISLLYTKDDSKDAYIEKCIDRIMEIMTFDDGVYIEIGNKLNFNRYINKNNVKLDGKVQIIESCDGVKILIPILSDEEIIGFVCLLKRNYDKFYISEETQRTYEMIKICISSQIEHLKKREIEKEYNKINLISDLIVESSCNAIITIDNKLNILKYNQKFLDMLNYSSNDFDKKSCIEIAEIFFHNLKDEKEKEKFEKLKENYRNGKRKFSLIFQFKNQKIYECFSSQTILDGKIVERVYVFKDITKLKNIETNIKNDLIFIKSLMESIPYPTFYKNRNGKYIGCNKAYEKFYNINAKDIIGKTIFEIYDKDDAERFNKKDKVLIKDGYTQEYEMKTFIKEDNEYRYVIVRKNLFYDSYGEIDGIIGSFIDVTELKKAQENEKILIKTIERDKLRTEFFANLSHEFRTPMNLIYSSIQLLEFDLDKNLCKEKVQKFLNITKQNCYRLMRLINNLIDKTKLDAGYYEVTLQEYDIVKLLENITSSIKQCAEIKRINITFQSNVNNKVILCDLDIIERVMLNLISNALKYGKNNPRGYGNIEIKLEASNKCINIRVKDDGRGIPKEKQNKIFDRFVKVDKSLNRSSEGSGIGLSLVKSLLELHNGDITLKSAEGVGTEFIITLPILKDIDNYRKYQENEVIDSRSIIEKMQVEFSDIYFEK